MRNRIVLVLAVALLALLLVTGFADTAPRARVCAVDFRAFTGFHFQVEGLRVWNNSDTGYQVTSATEPTWLEIPVGDRPHVVRVTSDTAALWSGGIGCLTPGVIQVEAYVLP